MNHGRRPGRVHARLAATVVMIATAACWAQPGESAPPIPAESETRESKAEGVVPGVDESTLEALESLGYLSGQAEQPVQTGVTRHIPDRAQPGFTLFISGHAPAAMLIDMDGAESHRWQFDAGSLYPVSAARNYWRRVHLCENGDLFALVDPHGIIKLNKDSELLFHTDGQDLLHHDFFVQSSGEFYAIGRSIRVIPDIHPETVIYDDTVVHFDREGRKLGSFSVYEAFRGTPWFDRITATVREVLKAADPEQRKPAEAFHTNTIEIFDGTLEGVSPLLREGHAVLCSPIQRNVFIVDLESGRVVWNWFAPWQRSIHQPTFLPNGNWLLFNNSSRSGSEADAASSVYELTFPGADLVWEYRGNPEDGRFYSSSSSLADRLANGNTLITVSNESRAIEVTPDGQIVWEFYNPYVIEADGEGKTGFADRGDGKIMGTLFQIERVPAGIGAKWIRRAEP